MFLSLIIFCICFSSANLPSERTGCAPRQGSRSMKLTCPQPPPSEVAMIRVHAFYYGFNRRRQCRPNIYDSEECSDDASVQNAEIDACNGQRECTVTIKPTYLYCNQWANYFHIYYECNKCKYEFYHQQQML